MLTNKNEISNKARKLLADIYYDRLIYNLYESSSFTCVHLLMYLIELSYDPLTVLLIQ